MSATRAHQLQRIGVMGGTFDPIHVGHLVAASEVLYALSLDTVIFMPAGDPWQKRSVAPAEDRLMMTSLAIADVAPFAASRIELDRKGPTYTADSLEALRDFYAPEVELFLIAGADAVLNLSTWKKLDRLRELVEVVAVTRPGFELDEFHATDDLPRVRVQQIPGIDVSASDIRDRVRRGEPIDFLVPRAVAQYIQQHGLYTSTVERSA